MSKANRQPIPLGPGLLFAGTAIGVSHLVQSTRAGADYGLIMVMFIVLANVLKYPFFEFGSRYAQVTGKHLIQGYAKRSPYFLYLYALGLLLTMFTVTGTVTFVTAGVLQLLLPIPINALWLTAGLLLFAIILTQVGKLKALETLMKVMGVVLIVCTLLAFVNVLKHGPSFSQTAQWDTSNLFSHPSFLFIIALMGWMPTAVDLSTWNSIWTVEKIKKEGAISLPRVLAEFRLGYWISAGLAVCFLYIGSYIMRGSGITFSNNAVQFTQQIIALFTQALGEGWYYIIAITAFITMLSTSLTVVDGYSRSLSATYSLLWPQGIAGINRLFPWLVSACGLLVISVWGSNIKTLVDIATSLSFLIAPAIALMNHQLIFSAEVPIHAQPSRWIKIWSISGIIFLILFAVAYVVSFLL
ncbi:divalent metal cation transporter [Cytophagales bacterium LB-30]|uniref:Divalent metal cation transporter n=1 Tax=Shiella aurantiaca TaxID=3058365 RepID=A0ABT8F8S2_9BACT|nr:divalent metal cation transporter [Shiella aurantiaca]MDN4166885.1 divalent metal cation transporter [Shiella aurantiaca]